MRTGVIWVLLGSKGGDNAQAIHLATALNLPFETKSLVMKPAFETAKPKVTGSLHHLDLARFDALAPPWPDLIIAVGRRLSMIALWIKAQSNGRTKIALIGSPKGKISDFDLVIAPVHYRVPDAPNVCRIGLPPITIDKDKLATNADIWRPKLAHLQRPLTVLLLGGTTGKRRFDVDATRSILDQAIAIKAENHGSLYVVTSRRTPVQAVDFIASELPKDAVLYRWQEGDLANPYMGLVALGDRFIITGDSVSMLVELARLEKPIAIAPLPEPSLLERLFYSKGIRDVGILHEFLYRDGWAVRLGEPFVVAKSPPPDDTNIVADRIRKLLQCFVLLAQHERGAEERFLGKIGGRPYRRQPVFRQVGDRAAKIIAAQDIQPPNTVGLTS